jgi:DNA-binding NtrC family response regulator
VPEDNLPVEMTPGALPRVEAGWAFGRIGRKGPGPPARSGFPEGRGPGSEARTVADPARISIMIVDDDDEYRSVIARRFSRRGYDVEQAGSPTEALRRAEEKHFHVVVLDVAMPEMDGVQLLARWKQVDPETQAIILTGQGTLETAVRAMKLGAYDFLTKPCGLAELELQVERAYEKAQLAQENRALKDVLRRTEPPGAIVGSSPAIQEVLRLIRKVAPTDSPVLIQGESGTGKELIARALHRGSLRADNPMVVINCAALQETLLESELFGHEKGAFTSAVASKQGLFELADHGTLFIDEIGDMAPALQAKLLRALEDGRIRRVGSTREIHTDVRLIAATNKDLLQEVAAGRFRGDLYYRLNVITLTSPPLRARAGDISLLVRQFLTRDPRGPQQIEPEALAALERYPWPGNVRELANVIERAKILSESDTVCVRDLPLEITQAERSAAPHPAAAPAAAPAPASPGTSLSARERAHIVRVLDAEGGNKARAARALGVSRRKLYRLLEKHGLADSAGDQQASPSA